MCSGWPWCEFTSLVIVVFASCKGATQAEVILVSFCMDYFFSASQNTFLNVEKKQLPFIKKKPNKNQFAQISAWSVAVLKATNKKKKREIKQTKIPGGVNAELTTNQAFWAKCEIKWSVRMFRPSEDEALKYFSWEWSFSFYIVLKCLPVSCVSVLCASSHRHSVYCALNNMVVWVHAGLLPSLASCYTAFRHCKADKLPGTWSPGFTSKQVLY